MLETKKSLTPMQRKFRKLKRNPKLFLVDSKAYLNTRKTLYVTWAKLGSFALVVLASLFIIAYYAVIASPRFVSESQFVVKEAGSSEVSLGGLAALGGSSPSMRDALILQKFIQSREMAMKLNNSVDLKSHYENTTWDFFSRLESKSSNEEYIEYFQEHVKVIHDEMSDVLLVEVQTFNSDYSLKVAQALLKISEEFINQLSDKMVLQQLDYAQTEVERAYTKLTEQQAALIQFQDDFKLYSPEILGGALVEAINQIEVEIIKEEAELKSLLVVMREDSVDVLNKQIRIQSLKEQVVQEQSKLTEKDHDSLNKVNRDFNEIKLKNELAADLYTSALVNLETVRADAYGKVKHLLVIEYPALAEDQKYPRRIYSIITWFISILLIYVVGRMVYTIIKEHQE
ncbi:lipopolysaccharide biosynthesis protein [Thalassotalea sp. HSM 43]|uniref:lipopolysaccharide biosynthesis protein n=1 Tax=Thalassotalea sp. HSM 43 TaxID=2552945 RepID=UPI0010801E32|nr:lipopolysaccharide biosynthesis protein [Thalassotalea sp. HSM 43]QBY03545.1 lipopolysaccharide biosynthesis protein [Thalassotalea sp. HSM 43]